MADRDLTVHRSTATIDTDVTGRRQRVLSNTCAASVAVVQSRRDAARQAVAADEEEEASGPSRRAALSRRRTFLFAIRHSSSNPIYDVSPRTASVTVENNNM